MNTMTKKKEPHNMSQREPIKQHATQSIRVSNIDQLSQFTPKSLRYILPSTYKTKINNPTSTNKR